MKGLTRLDALATARSQRKPDMTERATGQGSVPVDAPFERGELAVNAHTVLPNPLRRLTKPAGTKP